LRFFELCFPITRHSTLITHSVTKLACVANC